MISATGPAATRRPWFITTTWVQVCSTSASRWLDRITVRPGGRVPEQHVAHLPDLRRVEAVHRLVEHQQVRQAEHGLGDGQPLAHALGVGAHRAVEGGAEAVLGKISVGVVLQSPS